jgi:hypothetical protein
MISTYSIRKCLWSVKKLEIEHDKFRYIVFYFIFVLRLNELKGRELVKYWNFCPPINYMITLCLKYKLSKYQITFCSPNIVQDQNLFNNLKFCLWLVSKVKVNVYVIRHTLYWMKFCWLECCKRLAKEQLWDS